MTEEARPRSARVRLCVGERASSVFDDDRATLPEEQLQAEEDAQFEAVSAATVGPLTSAEDRILFVREKKLLDEMTEIAEAARGLPDARVRRLVQWIREKMCTPLESRLQPVSSQPNGAQQPKGWTPAPPTLASARWNLFHFDVPWNPSRMEQRNGRIDRKLQEADTVYCHYFVYRQRPEDRILRVLVRKTETIRKELGSLSEVIDARLADSLKLGIRRDRIAALEQDIESADLDPEKRLTVADELEASRERDEQLRKQIDHLRTRLEESQKSVGLDEAHFRSTISCALELLGAEPLKAVEETDAKTGTGTDRPDRSQSPFSPPRWAFPAIDQREGADPTWSDTLDTLRAPKEREQKFWEWRRTSPIRPVVFEDTGKMDEGVVHLHLEQRAVQRLLGRFIAQGFVYNDLSRACLAQTSDAIPRVVLLGRLCLYGPGAARLHEELVPVTARWTDPKVRKGLLSPYAREAELKTMDLLEEAILLKTGGGVTGVVLEQLQASAPRDVQELLPHLTARGEEFARDAEKKLRDRGQAEAKAMREILETQKKHITETVAKHEKEDTRQRLLGFAEDELRQLEANKRYWATRLSSLDKELETEPDRVRGVYQVKARRIEPVGLVYLWPVTG